MRVAPTALNGQKDRKTLYAGGLDPPTSTIYEGYLNVVVEQPESTIPARMHCEAAMELRSEIEEMQEEETTGLMDDSL
jgi:hypothetical protein